mmetsp:Transcript_20147/g.63106  ORF Transcript_20147/g.63106 Transcript_20147/m.63106 type:complete len:219 (-) Transcript_20147:878-1534(-)
MRKCMPAPSWTKGGRRHAPRHSRASTSSTKTEAPTSMESSSTVKAGLWCGLTPAASAFGAAPTKKKQPLMPGTLTSGKALAPSRKNAKSSEAMVVRRWTPLAETTARAAASTCPAASASFTSLGASSMYLTLIFAPKVMPTPSQTSRMRRFIVSCEASSRQRTVARSFARPAMTLGAWPASALPMVRTVEACGSWLRLTMECRAVMRLPMTSTASTVP